MLRFAVGIYIQLKMPFFVEVRGLKKIMTLPGRDRDWAKTAVGITGLRENFVRDGGIEEPYWGPSTSAIRFFQKSSLLYLAEVWV